MKQWTRKELKAEWIKALRSGKYKQMQSSITNECGTEHCCLGVLESVYYGKKITYRDFEGHTLNNGYSLADEVFPRLTYDVSLTLQHMNDWEGKTFNEIADYIEANL